MLNGKRSFVDQREDSLVIHWGSEIWPLKIRNIWEPDFLYGLISMFWFSNGNGNHLKTRPFVIWTNSPDLIYLKQYGGHFGRFSKGLDFRIWDSMKILTICKAPTFQPFEIGTCPGFRSPLCATIFCNVLNSKLSNLVNCLPLVSKPEYRTPILSGIQVFGIQMVTVFQFFNKPSIRPI